MSDTEHSLIVRNTDTNELFAFDSDYALRKFIEINDLSKMPSPEGSPELYRHTSKLSGNITTFEVHNLYRYPGTFDKLIENYRYIDSKTVGEHTVKILQDTVSTTYYVHTKNRRSTRPDIASSATEKGAWDYYHHQIKNLQRSL